jgi:pyridoxal phosphate enzyme (YggS family)
MSFADLDGRLSAIRAEIARRQVEGGWTHPVTIVAVTKGFGPNAVAAAVGAGLTDIGENRVQEALAKMDAVAARGMTPRWHLIGHLQRNKARFVPARFALVHTVDSLELAAELDRRAAQAGVRVPVLVQVNVAGEDQKSGCAPADAAQVVRGVARSAALAVEGLMAMAPFTDDEEIQRRTFREVRALRDRLQEDGTCLPTLSMGMSGDFGTAVAEGATLIRLGTALFGPRDP